MVRERQRVYLSLGSNLGDRVKNLKQALTALACERLTTKRVSSFFETEPVGYREQPWFLNIAVAAETLLSPEDLLRRCLDVERVLGRVRDIQGGPRTVDIDILLYGDRIIKGETLVIPHPRMAERKFVLLPLSEIAPSAIHPVLGMTVDALLAACPDRSIVRLYSSGDQS
jgi:2-amino-4-hydroxy-6-hydroxymethyldihydropteridine diphosphokinase